MTDYSRAWLEFLLLPWLVILGPAGASGIECTACDAAKKQKAHTKDQVHGDDDVDHPLKPGGRIFSVHKSAFFSQGLNQRNRNIAMTYKPEIRRRYHSRGEAFHYLSSRGFLFLPCGWANGRWRALVEIDQDDFIVTIWLTAGRAAVSSRQEVAPFNDDCSPRIA
jgi:hypothetical protein